MVWVAISSYGHSDTFSKPSALAISSKVYIEQCIRARLYLFIKAVYPNDNVLFWPDLASSYNSAATRAVYDNWEYHLYHNDMNPPNIPMVRTHQKFLENS